MKRSPEKITGNNHGKSEKSTKISTEMPTDHRVAYREASTSQCQLPMATDMSDTTQRLPILYEACASTVRGLGRAQAHLNTW